MLEPPLYILRTERKLTAQQIANLERCVEATPLAGRTVVLHAGFRLERIPLNPEAMVYSWYGYRVVPL